MQVTEIYKIQIDGQEFRLDDPIVTGRQLLRQVEKDDPNHVIYQWLPDGDMESLRPDETTDLRLPDKEKFLVFKTDRSYRFLLNGRSLEWGAPEITGRTLLRLANADPDSDVIWQETRAGHDKLIEDHDRVDLSKPEVEIFRTKPAVVHVTYNEAPFELPKGTYKTEKLREIFSVPGGYCFNLIVDGELIDLKPGAKIKVKNGMVFVSHAPRGESS